MREEFKAFYNANDDELQEIWNSENTLFVFDTNVLLNLYGYEEETRKDFFKIINHLKDKIWLPYHVGLEYQRRRLDIVRNEKKVFSDIDQNLKKIHNIFDNVFKNLSLKRRFPELSDSTDNLKLEIDKSIKKYEKLVRNWNKRQPEVRSEDKIRKELDSYFIGKTGKTPINQAWIDDLNKEGEDRYIKKIPPGFKDLTKAEQNDPDFTFNGLVYQRQYGDFIIWKQLIEKAKDENVINVVFITDDNKEDWWQKINSNGEKLIGALPELSAEIQRESNINILHLYSTPSFLEAASKNLKLELNKESISDASYSNELKSDLHRKRKSHIERKMTDMYLHKISKSEFSDNEKTKIRAELESIDNEKTKIRENLDFINNELKFIATSFNKNTENKSKTEEIVNNVGKLLDHKNSLENRLLSISENEYILNKNLSKNLLTSNSKGKWRFDL